MAKKYLDYDGLLYFWQKIKNVFVPNTRKVNGKALSADITLTASDVSALPSSTTIPSPGTGTDYPKMDGTKALGSNAGYARVDHVHPSDTSRVPTSRTVNSKALSSNIVLTGSDIAADSTSSATIAETFAAMEDEFATALDDKVDKVDGKGLSTNDYTTTEKNKLSGIASGAEVNQNAFSNVKVGSTTVAADTKTDTLELVAGTGISISGNTTDDKITINSTGLTSIEVDGTYTITPSASGVGVIGTDGGLTSDTDSNGVVIKGVSNTAAAGGTTLSMVTTGEKYLWNSKASTATATTSANGLMSSSDKTKLNGIATGAEVNQNAFSNIIVGTSTIAADGKTDTLTLEGSNVTLTPDAKNDKVTIGITASNVTTALGNTAVARATGDASGNNIANTYAPKASPALTGTPTAPTAAAGTNTTQIATTAFVSAAVTASGGEPNQNAFSKIKVGSTNVIADDPTDTLELVGSNVTLTPDGTDDKITIGITASNVTTALGNTAVARATADHMGNNINSIYAPKASPALSGTPTAPTAAAGTNTTQIATTAFVTSAIQTAQTGAATFQGTAPTSFAPTNYKKGYYWVVGTAGTYVTQTCEPGDMIFAIKDYGTAYAASDFNVIQTNLDITSIPNADIDTIVAS